VVETVWMFIHYTMAETFDKMKRIMLQKSRMLIGIVDLVDIPPYAICALLPKRNQAIPRGDCKNVPGTS
jgi:hypothetical protein